MVGFFKTLGKQNSFQVDCVPTKTALERYAPVVGLFGQVASLMDHEVGTHAIRFANEWSQPWAGRRADYGLPPSSSREVFSAVCVLAKLTLR